MSKKKATEIMTEPLPPLTEVRELKCLDKPTDSHKHKVVFTNQSRRGGEVTTMSSGLAKFYEMQGKVKIIIQEQI